MQTQSLISTDPRVCGGRPHIAGTRITVELIRDHFSVGHTIEEIMAIYPHLSAEQVIAARDYVVPAAHKIKVAAE